MFQNSGLWRPVCDCVAWLLCMPCGSPLAPLHTHCPACPLPEAVRPPGAGGAPNWASLPQGQVLLESQSPVAWRTSWPVVGGDGAGAVSSMALSRPEARVTAQPRWLALGGGHRAVPAGTSASWWTAWSTCTARASCTRISSLATCCSPLVARSRSLTWVWLRCVGGPGADGAWGPVPGAIS